MKQRTKASTVYKFYEKNANSVNCKICQKKLKFNGTAHNLMSHLQRIHPNVLSIVEVYQNYRPTEAGLPGCSKRFAADEEEGSDNNESDRLSLQQKVDVIKLYDMNPVCSSVAQYFPCGTKCIRKIIDSRDEILEEWNKPTTNTPLNEQTNLLVGHSSSPFQRTQCEMEILNNQMDVWIRDNMHDRNFDFSDERLKAKAFELMEVYNLKNISPKDGWVSWIRRKYHLNNGKKTASRKPPVNPLNRRSKSIYTKTRMIKLDVLNESVFEWILRMRSKRKRNQINKNLILQIAEEANKYIKVRNLNPGKNWFKKFKLKYNLTSENLQSGHISKDCAEFRKHLSLEISDIVGFVMQEKNWKCRTRRTRAEMEAQAVAEGLRSSQEVVEIVEIVDDDVNVKCEEVDDFDSDKCEEDDEISVDYVLVDCEEDVDYDILVKCEEDLDDEVHVKCEEDLDAEVDVKCEEDFDDEVLVKREGDVDDEVHVKCEEDFDDEVLVKREADVDDEVLVKCEEDAADEVVVTCEEDVDDEVHVKNEEDADDEVHVKCEEDVDDEALVTCEEDFEVQVKCEENVDDEALVTCEEDVDDEVHMKCVIEPADSDVVEERDVDEEMYEPRKSKRIETHDSRDAKIIINSDEEALRYLKALENFVLLQTNFRAIGVLSELEAVFRNK